MPMETNRSHRLGEDKESVERILETGREARHHRICFLSVQSDDWKRYQQMTGPPAGWLASLNHQSLTKPMTRWKASALHLSLSILTLGTIAGLLVWHWYPPGLFHMAKADKLLGLVAVVDVLIGPFLTLVVYKTGKKTLKFDLTVIALIQIAALGYGLRALWESRPVYLVASTQYFDLVFANEIDPVDLRAAQPEYQRLPAFGARTVGIVVPTDPAAREKALDLALAGKDMQFVPANYRAYREVAPTLLANTPPIALQIERLAPDARAKVKTAIHTSGLAQQDLALVPIYSSRGTAAALLDARDGHFMRPMDVEISTARKN